MTFDRFDIEKLNQLPILQVADKLGLKLNRSNKCKCFLHEERTPSFSVDSRKNRWKCFSCGEGGDIIKLVEKYNQCDFQNACKWLSNEFGIMKYNNVNPIRRKETQIRNTSDHKPDTEIYKWFFENLSVTETAKTFLKARKYPETIIMQYNLRGLNECKSFFKKCVDKWGYDRLVKCGLAKESVDKSTGEIYHKFTWWTSTLFFPFYNADGKIVYIQGRTLDLNQEKKHKYVNLNGVETSLFNQPVLNTLKKNDSLVITEGVTDCISCCLMGKNAVGVIGAQGFKKEYVNLLRDFDIVIIPDNDVNKTGEKFANKIRDEFQAIGKTVEIYPLGTKYKDISEYYMERCTNE
jgi:DNA primase catalytic core